ncbi:MAG: dihydroorotase [Paludisphaera borealis]|uniref:dihydroorotase n=1 Tax=Paludisphaera borealis TaxID=1387353 RepID=UPI002847FE32|nr:dihydroorotase [Paludisphaera borealis]MDR3623108.1 dihydroorotase [Paludisphaera borealis]
MGKLALPTIQITGGRIIDPAQGLDHVGDLWISRGRILPTGGVNEEAEVVIDARGKIVCPGLIDLHVHLREPGNEEDETIATGAASALAGGVTSVACMPNTIPPIDTQAAAEFVVLQGQRARQANVYPVGAVSKGRKGEELAALGQLVAGGAVAFTDDGAPVANAGLMRRALEYSKMFDLVIMQHCQVPELTVGGVMNEGFESMRLGLGGMPAAAEDIMVARDIRLAEITGGRLHIQHISTARSVELVREGKARGIKVTAEACPHHFSLTDECLRTFDSNFKMNPPLRTAADVEAVIEGLKDGTIEILATDHAPHAREKKMRELDQAPFGIVGLETLIPITVKTLIEPGHLTWPEVIRKLTINPAELLRIPKGTLRPGADADVTVIDASTTWTIDPTQFRSKSKNTPYAGWEVRGRAHTVIVGGEVRYTLGGIVQEGVAPAAG